MGSRVKIQQVKTLARWGWRDLEGGKSVTESWHRREISRVVSSQVAEHLTSQVPEAMAQKLRL